VQYMAMHNLIVT